MGILILAEETERLAHEIAEATGESINEVYHQALMERKVRLSGSDITPEEREARKLAFFARLDVRPRTQDPRSLKEIEDEELYGEYGQPIG